MKPCVQAVIGDPDLNGVYRLVHATTGVVPSQLPTVDARRCHTKDSLLLAIGRELSFPDYYGANWDALEECLNDMSWQSGAIALHIEHAAELPSALLETLTAIFGDAASAWQQAGRGCSLFLSGLKTGTLPKVSC